MLASQARATLLAVALMIASTGSSAAQSTSKVADEHIAFATYFGGSGFDGINGTATDADGNLIIVGLTSSADLPVLNAVQPTLGGSFDAFVAKIDPVEGTLLFSTYLGGSGTDFFEDVVVDEAGNLYIVGTTGSGDFPGAAAKVGQGSEDLVIVRFSADGQIQMIERIGGSGAELGSGVALFNFNDDGILDIGVTGTTASDNLPLFNPVQNVLVGGIDAFIYVVDGSTGDPLFGTYAGGSNDETSNDIIIGDFDGDGVDDILTVGGTDSDDFATRGRTAARMIDPYLLTLTTSNAPPGLPFALQADLFPIDEANPNLLDGDDEAWAATFIGSTEITSPPIVAMVGLSNSSVWPTTGVNVLQEQTFPNDNTDGFVGAFADYSPIVRELILFYSSPLGGVGNEICRGIDFDGINLNMNCASESFLMLDGFPQIGSGPFVQLTVTDEFEFERLVRTGSTNFANMQIQGGGGGSCLGGWSQFGREITDSPAPALQPEQSGSFDGFTNCFEGPSNMAMLEVSKTPSETSPRIGQEVKYTIQVTNTSSVDAVNVFVNDMLIEVETLRLLGADHAFIRERDDLSETIMFDTFDLPAGETREIDVKYRVTLLSTFEGGIQNFVSLKAANSERERANASIVPRTRDGKISPLVSDSFGFLKRGQTAFDMYVDSVRVTDDLTTATAFLPVTLQRTTPRIDLTDAGAPDNSDPFASFDIDLLYPHPDSILAFSQTSVLVFAGLDTDAPRAVLKHAARTEAIDPAQVDFFVAHIAEGVGPVDVRLLDDTPAHAVVGTVADDLMPDTTSDYISVPPGGYNLEVTSADGTTVLDVFYFDWSAAAGQAFSVVIGGEDGALAVAAVNASGNVAVADLSTVAEAVAPSAADLVLHPAYPNPFLAEARIEYDLPQAARVRLAIFDVLGREVAVLVEEEQTAGRHMAVWHGRGAGERMLASGIYYCRLRVGEVVRERPLLFVR